MPLVGEDKPHGPESVKRAIHEPPDISTVEKAAPTRYDAGALSAEMVAIKYAGISFDMIVWLEDDALRFLR